MTVCVAVKVNDCIVFAADSASTLVQKNQHGEQSVLNVYNNADKVYNLHRELPIAAMTCGMGNIGNRSMSSLAKELRQQLMQGTPDNPAIDCANYSVKEIADRARAFIGSKYNDESNDRFESDYLEFWIGGYGSDNQHGEIWKVVIAEETVQELHQVNQPDETAGIFWGGQAEAIHRLILGIDPQLIGVLVENGVDQTVANQIYNTARPGLEVSVCHATMPTIDAIRLSRFLVSATIDYFSLKFGSDIVGGVTDIATVTKYEGFKWIERKHYYPADLNRETNGHVC